jgi:hypothetical protein
MTVDVEIRVENGKVTICVGPQSSSSANGAVAGQGMVGGGGDGGTKGGNGANEDTGSGAPSSGTMVIGPIVVDGFALQANPPASGNTGTQGGNGANEDTGSGAGVSGSGTVVIGPIVICGQRSGGASSAKKVAKQVSVNP